MDCFQVRRIGAPLIKTIDCRPNTQFQRQQEGETFEPDTSTARSFGAVVPGLDCKGSGNALKLNEVKAKPVDLGTIHGVLSVLPFYSSVSGFFSFIH